MTPLKILHTDFHRGWGGQASRVLMLSKELARRGHRVTIAAPAGELTRRAREAAAEAPGLGVEDGFGFRAPSHVISFLRDARRMRNLLAAGDYDIVDVHGSQDAWVTAVARIASGLPRCLVLTRHNTKRVRTGRANRMLYGRMVDHLIIVDDSVRRQYAAFLHDGVLDPSRISVVPSAYRADLFHDRVDGSRIRRDLGIDAETLVIGVAGRLVVDKGHTHLLKAAALLRSDLPRIAVVFAGAGPNEARLRAEVDALGLAAAVRFLGFRSDIAEVEAGFDVAVLPSVGCDASSASIKEAMALGVPVIASDIGGARGIIEDGVTGLVVPPGDPASLAAALRRILSDRSAARAMADRARATVVRRFSVARLCDETLQAYATAMMDSDARRGLRQQAAAARARKTA